MNKRVALVTGGDRGIGKAIVLRLAENGVNIALNYLNDDKKATETLSLLHKYPIKANLYRFDVSNYDSAQKMINCVIKDLGALDILVNNAGIINDKKLENMLEDDWDKVIRVNLKSVFNCTKFALPHLKNSQSGRIICISSVIAQQGGIGQSNYAASKAGIIGFVKSLALELAKENITVNAVAPGFIDTDMLKGIPKYILEKYLLPKIPQQRFGKPEEVAELIAYLVSDKANYVTGQTFSINGGLYL